MFNLIKIRNLIFFEMTYKETNQAKFKFNVGGFDLDQTINVWPGYVQEIMEGLALGYKNHEAHVIGLARKAYVKHILDLKVAKNIEDVWIGYAQNKAGYRYKIDGRCNGIYLCTYTNDSELYDEFTEAFCTHREDEIVERLEIIVANLYETYWEENYSGIQYISNDHFILEYRQE